MNTELNRRVINTLFILFVCRALCYVPIPGIDLAMFIRLIETSTSEIFFGGLAGTPVTIGALGIFPYIAASVILVLFFYFRKFRHNVDDRDVPIEFYTLILTGIISLLQGYSIAVSLESLGTLENGSHITPYPGWSFRLLTMLSITIGTYLLVWLAKLITRYGIGNGVCLFILVDLLIPLPKFLLSLKGKIGIQRPDDVIMHLLLFLLLAIVTVIIIMRLMHARWHMPLQGKDESSVTKPIFSLHINSVGTAGYNFSQMVLSFIIISLSALGLSTSGNFIQKLSESIGRNGPIYWTIFGSVAFFATYWLAALAYSPRSLQNLLDKFNNLTENPSLFIENKLYNKRLAIVTIPLAIVVSILFAFFSWQSVKYSLYGLSPISLFVIAAIALDTHRQFQQHRQIATIQDGKSDEIICENCGHEVDNEEKYCYDCGVLFEENANCEEHTDVEAHARCIICGKKLCSNCCFESNKRFVCEAHSDVELLQGWATITTARTRIDAEFYKQRLADIPALVYSNTIEPIYGTLGLFDINPVTPLFVYRELGGGQIRVMVPIHEWMKAQEHLERLLG